MHSGKETCGREAENERHRSYVLFWTLFFCLFFHDYMKPDEFVFIRNKHAWAKEFHLLMKGAFRCVSGCRWSSLIRCELFRNHRIKIWPHFSWTSHSWLKSACKHDRYNMEMDLLCEGLSSRLPVHSCSPVLATRRAEVFGLSILSHRRNMADWVEGTCSLCRYKRICGNGIMILSLKRLHSNENMIQFHFCYCVIHKKCYGRYIFCEPPFTFSIMEASR